MVRGRRGIEEEGEEEEGSAIFVEVLNVATSI